MPETPNDVLAAIQPPTLRSILLWCGAVNPDDEWLQQGLARLIDRYKTTVVLHSEHAPALHIQPPVKLRDRVGDFMLRRGVKIGARVDSADVQDLIEQWHMQEQDSEMLRLKACEEVAEGNEGWEKITAECPSIQAVINLRLDYQLAVERVKDRKTYCHLCAEYFNGEPEGHGLGECVGLCSRCQEHQVMTDEDGNEQDFCMACSEVRDVLLKHMWKKPPIGDGSRLYTCRACGYKNKRSDPHAKNCWMNNLYNGQGGRDAAENSSGK